MHNVGIKKAILYFHISLLSQTKLKLTTLNNIMTIKKKEDNKLVSGKYTVQLKVK